MDAVPVLAAVAATQLLAAASPGPTFVVVTTHATGGSRRAGLQAAAGVLAATATWASLATLGLGAVVARLPWLYSALQLAGAAYLVFLGGRMVFGALRSRRHSTTMTAGHAGGWAAIRAGFLANITNPKSVAYYASLFAVVVPQAAPSWLFGSAAAAALLVSAAWWVAVASLFSLPSVRRLYERARRGIDLLAGGVLVALGCRLALSR